jgi:uncharacterized protein (TIGR01319 family)
MKGILIDFGSTFTKVIVVDVETGKLLARSKSASTVRTDVTIGLRRALSNIGLELSDLKRQKFDYKLSCSSAAGGLRMVSIGLVPQFTVEAAKKTALGAGANVLEVYAYDLTSDELKRIEAQNPKTSGQRRMLCLNYGSLILNQRKRRFVKFFWRKSLTLRVLTRLKT